MKITITTQESWKVIIDTISWKIDVQWDCDIAVDSSDVVVSRTQTSFDSALAKQVFVEKLGNESMRASERPIEPEEVEHKSVEQEIDCDDEDEITTIDEVPNALWWIKTEKKKLWRPINDKVYHGKSIAVWRQIYKNQWSPTPISDRTRVNRIPYQDFMNKKNQMDR